MEKLSSTRKQIILIGDLNINLLHVHTGTHAQSFNLNLTPTIDKPTRVHNNSYSLIDNITCLLLIDHAPTLSYSKALAHWRQVGRNYLFQGGYPPSPGGAPPPGSISPPRLWDLGPTPGGRSGTFILGWLPPVPPDLYSPQGGPPS